MALGSFAFANAYGSRIFRFPFLFCGVWIAFVILGFLEFVVPENGLYHAYEDTGVVDVALIVIITSAAGGLIGYASAGGVAPKPWMPQEPVPVSPKVLRRMHIASIVITVMSFLAFLALAQLAGGLAAYVFYSGSYSITWEGLPVYLVFVVRFGYVAIVIQLWLWSRTGKLSHFLLALFFTTIPFINIFFVFRRSEVVTIGVYYGYFITNYTRVHLGRAHALGALAMMFLAFRVFPLLRNEAGKELSWSELLDRALAPRIDFDSSEIGAGLFRIYYSMTEKSFEFGAIIWNAIIKQFVPGSIVGADIKNALLLPTLEYESLTFADFRFYLSPMGFAQAYQQIWLFAALIFVLIGYLAAKMEQRRFMGPRQEVFLVLMLPVFVTAVSADLSLIVSRAITFAVLVAIAIPAVAFQGNLRDPAAFPTNTPFQRA